MSCYICANKFSVFRKEKACPSCGFSYCSKCIRNKMYVEKLKTEVQVCDRCKNSKNTEPKPIEPPDAYFRRLGVDKESNDNSKDKEILAKLKKLQEDKPKPTSTATNEEIARRLQKIRETPTTSDVELESRLANLRGIPITSLAKPSISLLSDKRTDQEKVNDLLKQYSEKHKIDKGYTDELDKVFSEVESRLNKLKGPTATSATGNVEKEQVDSSEDEEETVNKILEKIKIEAKLEADCDADTDEINKSSHDELPFCEICNEDACLRCLGCRYLFCKRCFLEHKDDDDGCDKYEPYPKR